MRTIFYLITAITLVISPLVVSPQWDSGQLIPGQSSEPDRSETQVAVLEAKLLPTPEGIGGQKSQFGTAVSVQGNRMLVGAPRGFVTGQGVDHGLVHVFELSGAEWEKSATIKPISDSLVLGFGVSVSLQDNRALIGTRSDIALVFEYDGVNWNQTAVITPNTQLGGDFGASVSLYGDRALIGAYLESENGSQSGAAYVFDYVGGSWLESQNLTPTDIASGDFFGFSLSLSEERALVSSLQDDDNGAYSGSVYVFDYSGDEWLQSHKLTSIQGTAFEEFGYSVSLSGNRALIGAVGTNSNDGSAYVFDFNGSDWAQTHQFSPTDLFTYFGNAVSLSGDRALIGAYLDNENGTQSGAAFVYDFYDSAWFQTQKLLSSLQSDGDLFGCAVSLSGDRAVIGAKDDDSIGSNSGAAYVFDYDGQNWEETQKTTGFIGAAFDEFGYALSVSGNRVIVGAYNDDDNRLGTGSAYIFEHVNNQWELMQKIIPDDSVFNFGQAVSIEGDRALIGDFHPQHQGFAYVYEYNGQRWQLTQRLEASDGVDGDWFGGAVDISGDRIIVGASNDSNVNGSQAGSAYLFVHNGTNWEETQKLISLDGTYSDGFGSSVSIEEDVLLVGSHTDVSGSAYVFNFNGVNWNQTQKLVPSDGRAGDLFGGSLSMLGDRVLIGAQSNDETVGFAGEGAAYVFEKENGVWTEVQKIIADDYAGSIKFGRSVAMNEQLLLIGSLDKAYTYVDDGIWVQSTEITDNSANDSNRIGFSVGLSQSLSFIGSPFDDTHGANSGSVSIFSIQNDFIFSDGFD